MNRPLHRFELSVATRYFLNRHEFWQLRDLRDRAYYDLRGLEGCSLPILFEIHRLVTSLHAAHHLTPERVRELRLQHLQQTGRVHLTWLRPGKPRPKRAEPPDRPALARHKIRNLGELDGRLTREFYLPRLCCTRTLAQLHEIIRQAKTESAKWPALVIEVSAACRHLDVAYLPASVRLQHFFRNGGIYRLGDLHGRPLRFLRAMRNFGQHSEQELLNLLARADQGEFHPLPETDPWQPVKVLRYLDELFARLPERQQAVLKLRFGAAGEPAQTLDAVSRHFHCTRERIRQLQSHSLRRLLQHGSIPILGQEQRLKELCHTQAQPLTVAQVASWREPDAPALRFAPVFYVRLLAALFPGLPVEPTPKAQTPKHVGCGLALP